MAYDWKKLLKLMPIVAGSIDPRAGVIAEAAEALFASEFEKAKQSDPALTFNDWAEQALAHIAASDSDFDEGIGKSKEFLKKGHEGEG